ncbi:MAG: glycerol-3-phosphate 1-O-acyltransferase PlsY [Pseudomonadota bacterium]|jgi:glycerol-3-phosphate acyltransferase PlsY
MIANLSAVVIAYLIGSLSFAVIVSRLMGLNDPRTYGSGNPGATNVLRSGNKAAAALTLLLDAIKGWLPVWVVARWGSDWGLSDAVLAPVALAAFVGHVWPVFFRFQGGKGVATAAGVLIGIQPWLGLATLATWLIVVYFSRISSLGAVCAAVFAPFFYVWGSDVAWPSQPGLGLSIAAMGIVLLYRHSANISRLLKGTEPRIGQSKKS